MTRLPQTGPTPDNTPIEPSPAPSLPASGTGAGGRLGSGKVVVIPTEFFYQLLNENQLFRERLAKGELVTRVDAEKRVMAERTTMLARLAGLTVPPGESNG